MYHFKYGRFRFDKVIIFSLYMTFFEKLYLQKTSAICNFISMFKVYKQCVIKPKVTTKVVIYPVFSTPITVNL